MSELDKLEQYLKVNGFVYEREDRPADKKLVEFYKSQPSGYHGEGEFHQIRVYDKEENRGYDFIWDAICHYGSYGFEHGLLEVMGTIVRDDAGDSVEGWLTAQDIIDRLEA